MNTAARQALSPWRISWRKSFGNIFDEYDEEEEEDITEVSEGVYRIDGSTDLQDVEEQLGITFEENEDYDTLGGYLIGQLGHIPEEGETIEMKLCGWLFSVELFEEKRILKVLATKLPEEEKEKPKQKKRLTRNKKRTRLIFFRSCLFCACTEPAQKILSIHTLK